METAKTSPHRILVAFMLDHSVKDDAHTDPATHPTCSTVAGGRPHDYVILRREIGAAEGKAHFAMRGSHRKPDHGFSRIGRLRKIGKRLCCRRHAPSLA